MPRKKVETEKPKKRKVSAYHQAAKAANKNLQENAKKKYNYTKKPGRPSIFTQELGDYICKIVATNPGGLKKLCAMFDRLPDEQTINEWRWKNKDFGGQYLAAKENQMHLMLEECEDLAKDVLYYHDKDGNKRIDAPSIAQQTVIINMRKWHASKLAPRFYGERVMVEESKGQNDEMMQELLSLRAELAAKNKKEY